MDGALARLGRWDAMSGEVYAQMIAEPGFPRASRALARATLGFSDADTGLDNLFRDSGSYVAAMWVVYLHAQGEVTLPALKAIGASSGFLSTGRARDLLNLMQHLKFIEMLSPAVGAAPARYGPTSTFLERWFGHHRGLLAATVEVEPEIDILVAHLRDPTLARTFARVHARNLLVLSAGTGADNSFYHTFIHRRSGGHVISLLALSGEDDAPFPDEAPIALAPGPVARRFNVSRIHIKRMVDDGVAQGFLEHHGKDAVTIAPGARPIFQFHYSFQLVQLLAAARETWEIHAEQIAAQAGGQAKRRPA